MKKLVLLSLTLVFLLTGCFNFGGEEGPKVVLNTASGAHSFIVEVADEREERERGLMFRESLEQGKGMIFIYDEPQPKLGFWMKNTYIPLDMIFIDENYEVIDYFENLQLCEELQCPHYVPNGTSQYILEVNAGVVQEIGLSRGDKAEILL